MRILGLDYGSKRIGAAISDELGMTGQPLMTIERKNRQQDMEAVEKLIKLMKLKKSSWAIRFDWTGRKAFSVKSQSLFPLAGGQIFHPGHQMG